jgi:hypothetical protein
MLRAYPVLADRGAVPHLIWMSQDRRLGERNYAVREAYEWAHHSMPVEAVLQFDPHITWQDTPAFLYSDRQIAAADEHCLAGFGGDQRRCASLMTVVKELYPDKAGVAPASMSQACNSLPASIVAAKDTDSVWKTRDSWVWREKPVFANEYIRLFGCGNKVMKTAAAR